MPATIDGDADVASLPDVATATLPEQKYFDGLPFPLVLVPAATRTSSEWEQWARDNLDKLKTLLIRYGAIFFRGFPFDDPEKFDLFAKSFGWTEFPYVGGVSVRRPVVGNVYTSTEAPPEGRIPFHHEMAHVQDYPKVLFAYCDVAPPEGGQTPLLLSNIVYRKMSERDPAFVQRLKEEGGLCYVRVAPETDDISSALGRSWKSTFFAEDREAGELNAKKAGFKVEWMPDGSMKYTSSPLEAIRIDPRTGKTIWFNSSHTCYNAWTDARNDRTKAVLFPNGDPMDPESMDTLNQVMSEAAVSIRWQKGDVAMVDNVLVQHSRNHYTPPRRVLVSLFKD